MHFTGIKIVGFKSFADPVDFAIHTGLTGIVGPNGCGKSNILESLRWVMGATSARAMRGGEMDDLIFSGSSNRPARENAEVSLILDNTARTAPYELNDSDIIEVRRKLRRGAGSSYKINGRTVRAKDVQLLFADASTGANSPALVRQGQISELISSKPQNRRRILEEAAGIAGLNQRRHEAELKLRAAADSLSRLDEIIGEVEKQLGSLKRQASRARKYRELQDEIDFQEIHIALVKWNGANSELLQTQSLLAEAKQAVDTSSREEAKATALELARREAIPHLRGQEAEASGRVGALKLDLARLDGEKRAANDLVSRLESDQKRIIDDQAREHGLREDAMAALLKAENAHKSLPVTNTAALEAAKADLEREISKIQLELDALDQQREQLSNAQATQQTIQQNAQSDHDRANKKLRDLNAELERAKENLSNIGDEASLQQAVMRTKTDKNADENDVVDLQNRLNQLEEQTKSANQQEHLARVTVQESTKALNTLEAELSGLKRLSAQPDEAGDVPVLDSTHPAAGMERALAAALGDTLKASTNREAKQYWSEVSPTQLPTLPGKTLSLADHVNAPKALQARLAQCGIVDADQGPILQKELLPGQCLVSREGDLWRWDGFVKTSKAPSSASEQLEQKARILKLEAQISACREAVKRDQAKLETATQALEGAKTKENDAKQKLTIATQAASRSKEAFLIAEQALERFALRSSMIADNIARIEDAQATAKDDLESAQQKLASISFFDPSELDRLRVEISRQREQERTKHSELSNLTQEQDRISGRRNALEREIKDWKKRVETADIRLTELQTLRKSCREQLEVAKERPASLELELASLSDRLQQQELAQRAAMNELSTAESELREAESNTRRTRDQASKDRESLVRVESNLQATGRRAQELQELIEARFQITPDELSKKHAHVTTGIDPLTLPDMKQAEARLAQLQREKEAIGGVNLEAEEQIMETAGRLEAQLRERDDLDQAIAKLQEGVHALNAQGRELLLKAFETVAAHFKTLFETLFEGGEAQLKLTESDDPLEAGLEIYACPPGKRLSALSLMSGGEQALTATALIFAVFLSQPSPLCVLDEVDAPLDDANVDRFCRMLDAMKQKTDTRFIVITHNPVTMSRMDRLFGVTMQERGVSRLVSVDLQSAEQLVAAQ